MSISVRTSVLRTVSQVPFLLLAYPASGDDCQLPSWSCQYLQY